MQQHPWLGQIVGTITCYTACEGGVLGVYRGYIACNWHGVCWVCYLGASVAAAGGRLGMLLEVTLLAVLVGCGGSSDSVSSGLVLLSGDHSPLAGL